MSKIAGYLTVQEVADKLKVSHSQAARYVRGKTFRGTIKIGNQSLVPRKEVEGFEKPSPGRRKRKSA